MIDAKGISTPLQGGPKLSKLDSNYMDDLTLYRSIVGALRYMIVIRSKINYSINKVCQFLAQPLLDHWSIVKRILRYLSFYISWFTTFCYISLKRLLHLTRLL